MTLSVLNSNAEKELELMDCKKHLNKKYHLEKNVEKWFWFKIKWKLKRTPVPYYDEVVKNLTCVLEWGHILSLQINLQCEGFSSPLYLHGFYLEIRC